MQVSCFCVSQPGASNRLGMRGNPGVVFVRIVCARGCLDVHMYVQWLAGSFSQIKVLLFPPLFLVSRFVSSFSFFWGGEKGGNSVLCRLVRWRSNQRGWKRWWVSVRDKQAWWVMIFLGKGERWVERSVWPWFAIPCFCSVSSFLAHVYFSFLGQGDEKKRHGRNARFDVVGSDGLHNRVDPLYVWCRDGYTSAFTHVSWMAE